MEAENFVTQLSEYVSNGFNSNDDLFEFIKGLILLTRKVQMIKKAQNPYIVVAKKWISAFQIIRGKIDNSREMLSYISKFCSAVTIAFLRLAKSFRQYETNYTQELFCHWKGFLSMVTTTKRFTSFSRYDVILCQMFIQHLKNAKNRCEQISILAVLTLYTTDVLPEKLSGVWQEVKRNNEILFENDLIKKLIQLGPNPSLIAQHLFIKGLNDSGNHIITTSATKMVCENLNFHFVVPKDEMWTDFNLKDRSLMISALSKITGDFRWIGIVTLPELKENFNSFNEYMLTITGQWNILAAAQNPIRVAVSITLIVPILVRTMIWKRNVRSCFRVLPIPNFIDGRANVSVSNRIKRRRFTTILEPLTLATTSDSSSDFPGQFKKPRMNESTILPKTKSWDNEFDRLKYSD